MSSRRPSSLGTSMLVEFVCVRFAVRGNGGPRDSGGCRRMSTTTHHDHATHVFRIAFTSSMPLWPSYWPRTQTMHTHTPRATCHRKHFGSEIKHCLRQAVHTARSSKPPEDWTDLQCTHANRRISKEVVQTQEIYFPPSAFTQTSKPEDKSRICCNPGTEVSNLEMLDKGTTQLPEYPYLNRNDWIEMSGEVCGFRRRSTSVISSTDWTRSTLTDPWFVALCECSDFGAESDCEDFDDVRRKSHDIQQSEWNKQRRDCMSYKYSRGTSLSEENLTVKMNDWNTKKTKVRRFRVPFDVRFSWRIEQLPFYAVVHIHTIFFQLLQFSDQLFQSIRRIIRWYPARFVEKTEFLYRHTSNIVWSDNSALIRIFHDHWVKESSHLSYSWF